MNAIPGMPSGNSVQQQRRANDARLEKARANYTAWFQQQGKKIRAHRPEPVADHCILLAIELSARRFPLMLKAQEIEMSERRALSQARVAKFGPLPRSEEQWRAQCDEIRAGWAISRETTKTGEAA